MKTIMLAVCGPRPHEEAVGYSLRLAQRLKARLEVLQIVAPPISHGWQRVIQALKKSSRAFEEGMVAATFAEMGEHKEALEIMGIVSEAVKNAGHETVDASQVEFRFLVGNPEVEIPSFVAQNHDVILGIIDNECAPVKGSEVEKLSKKTGIPMIAVQKK
jgi:hypothetical protein